MRGGTRNFYVAVNVIYSTNERGYLSFFIDLHLGNQVWLWAGGSSFGSGKGA